MTGERRATRRIGLLATLGPGVLVAATGVGAGDLAVAGLVGARLGLAVLWAVVVGALLKYILTEGLARWQIATGETLLEGALRRGGLPLRIAFLAYLLPWTFFVGGALISACGVTAAAIRPLSGDPALDKAVYGAAQSLVALALVWRGGFKLFERVMSVAIAVMFCTVVVTAALLRPDVPAVIAGLTVPRVPAGDPDALLRIVGLIGGVGGTLTLLCYSYWMREAGRIRHEHLRTCRIDLAVGYAMTAAFGVGMVIIAQGVDVSGSGAGFIVGLAGALTNALGPAAGWIFLLGAWAAVFSSLLGVWQAVPSIFADAVSARNVPDTPTSGPAYKGYLIAIATVPMFGLFIRFETAQMMYAVVGALFLPALAVTLIVLTVRSRLMGAAFRSRSWTIVALSGIALFFIVAGAVEIRARFGGA